MKIPRARTKQESQDLIRRLDEMVENSNVSAFTTIQNYQADHRQLVFRQYSRFMNQFEMFFCSMIEYSSKMNYVKKNWPINRGFQFIIATRALKQFYSAYNLFLDGAYEDSLTVLRSVYESFLRIIFVSCHPECPYNAFRTKGQTGAQFNATGLVKDQLKLDWATYDITSAFAHSNQLIIMEDVIELSNQPKVIGLSYDVNNELIQILINNISFLITAYLTAYEQLFTVDVPRHKQEGFTQKIVSRLHSYAQISRENLRTHNSNKNWRKISVDLDNIFELIKSMDANPELDWIDKWNEIRRTA